MNPRRPILRVLPNYTHGFCRWVGEPLSRAHKAIIETIERARQTSTPFTPARVIVEDPDPSTSGIPRLLALYLQWLTLRVLPHRQAVALDSTVCHSVVTRLGALCYGLRAAKAPDRLRGRSFDIALLLNAHLYPRRGGFTKYGPDHYLHRVDRFADALRVILPMIGSGPESLLIIHGSPRRRRDHFQQLLRSARQHAVPYTHISPRSLPANNRPIPISSITPISPIGPIGPIRLIGPISPIGLKALPAPITPPPAKPNDAAVAPAA